MSEIDELLIEAKRVCGERRQKAPEYPWEIAARFGAEVERLRALLRNIAGVQRGGGPCDIDTGDEVLEQAQRVHLESFDRAQKLGQARSRVGELQMQYEGVWAKVRELEAENAELRGLVDAAKIYLQQNSDEILALRARLAWFEKREVGPLRPVRITWDRESADALLAWEQHNPKPSEGT